MRTALLANVALLLAVAAGCGGRAHLTPSHGAAARKAFAAQQVAPAATPRPPSGSLDTQEAEVVAQGYIRSLAGKTRAEEPGSVLYVAPQRQGPAPLAPSVPKN
jgi:hypothetical protein